MAYDQNVISVAAGGTGSSSFGTSNGIIKYNGTNLVASTATFDSSNRLTMASQPSCLVAMASTVASVTGDGTVYTIIFDTSIYDQNSNFSLSGGTFTAPIAGIYLFTLNATFTGLVVGNTTGSVIVDNGNVPFETEFNPVASAVGGVATFSITSCCILAANQTFTPKVSISGGTKSVGISGLSGSSRALTSFSCSKVA